MNSNCLKSDFKLFVNIHLLKFKISIKAFSGKVPFILNMDHLASFALCLLYPSYVGHTGSYSITFIGEHSYKHNSSSNKNNGNFIVARFEVLTSAAMRIFRTEEISAAIKM